MDAPAWPSIITLILLVAYAVTVADSTYVVEQPYHTAVVFLCTIAVSLAALPSCLFFLKRSGHSAGDHHRKLGSGSGRPFALDATQWRRLGRAERTTAVILVVALVARSWAFNFYIQHVECTSQTLAPLSPAFLLVLEPAWRRLVSQRSIRTRVEKDHVEDHKAEPSPSITVIRVLAVMTAILGNVATLTNTVPRSTYICATTGQLRQVTPIVQSMSTLLDVIIIIAINNLLTSAKEVDRPRAHVLGYTFLTAAGFILLIGTSKSLLFTRSLRPVTHVSSVYAWGLLKAVPLVSLASLIFIISLHNFGTLFVSIILSVTVVATRTTSLITGYSVNAGLPLTSSTGALATVGTLMTLVSFLRSEHSGFLSSSDQSRRTTMRALLMLQLTAIATATFYAYFWWRSFPSPFVDQYENAIWNQQSQQSMFEHSARASANISHAAGLYHARHGKWPPPGFDKWYEYATERQSVIIDTFDNIYLDILPFYALDPAEIRERTHDLIANPNNEVAGVLIRDGRAHAGPHINTNNRAMIDGLVKMINHFAEFLPDMDLAFNTKESGAGRVVVPWAKIRSMRDAMWKGQPGTDYSDRWQPGRPALWPRMSNEAQSNSIMTTLHAEKDNIYRYSTVWCPPESRARREHYWNVKNSCTKCGLKDFGYAPYGWRQMHDVCDQPDLQRLHGMYAAPSSFKATHEVYPVFSSARANGFMDILYPSVWDWLERTQYVPDASHRDSIWKDKKGTLFWRGTTTEGVSFEDRKWQGMLRQRFVHLINNIRGVSPPALLLVSDGEPNAQGSNTRYVEVPAQAVTSKANIDVQFSPDIINCREADCHVQRWEFAPTQNLTHFQDHWQHRYLLDLDGPSSSASFLPFLRSRSLPLKAGLMQEWWRDRVRPWVHFVPIDVRGLDFWTTLTWFTGFEDTVAGKLVQVQSHEAEAERIATAGRQWADIALRKEDMEIYFFRLLLEWARVTDDWRDQIGYTGLT